MIEISIIIPTLNRAILLDMALEAITKQTFQQKKFEIIVVDNGSSDTTKGVCEKYSSLFVNFKYIYDANPGLLTGRHHGANIALGDILAFIDDDIVPSLDWLKTIITGFERNPRIDIIGSKSIPLYEEAPPAWIEYFWEPVGDNGKICSSLSLLDLGENEKEVDPCYVWGLNYSIRKKAYNDAKGFHPDCMPIDKQCYQGDGETGLSIKLREMNKKALYIPEAWVYHQVPKVRLSLEYFCNRYFFQGICNSYTDLRMQYGLYKKRTLYGKYTLRDRAWLLRKKIVNVIQNLLKISVDSFTYTSYGEALIKQRCACHYQSGYNFHQWAVKNNPELLKWVLKEDYFDYKLPEL